ncbi:MAG: bifunctional 23S rRNA (guanine(2069)-N(7))-methyltransferase RlmK/23S rRNA (guanine(2445)-N(2))-methyltransferase RlmL [Planctomycetota bacterium]
MKGSTLQFLATTAFGLEAITRRELEALGITAKIQGAGRIAFDGDIATMQQASLWLRTADRVLLRVAEFPAADFDALFETTRSIPWGQWIPGDASFPVTGRSIQSTLSSVPACQRAVKRAIVDALRRDHGQVTLPETGASYKVDVSLLKDLVTLTIDTTGPSLHRRGYRTDIRRAPLKETLAAALVMLTFWKPERPLLDPFCGSGTIPIEAAMIGRNMVPGRNRHYAFMDWPSFDQDSWDSMTCEADAKALPKLPERLIGRDIDPAALVAARDNAERAGVIGDVHFEPGDMRSTRSQRRFGCLVTNPPYGIRLGHDDDLDDTYRAIPDVLRRLPTWSSYFLTAYPDFESTVGRSADRRRKLYNGRIECTYFQFHGPRPLQADAAQLPSETCEPESAGQETSGRVPERADAVDGALPRTYVHAVGPAAFGELDAKARHQAELFASRLRKRQRHLRRWPNKRGITCYRLYERDIPEIPLAVDRYEDHLHLIEFERPHDRDPAQHGNWLDLMAKTAGEVLDVRGSNVFLKRRGRQSGRRQHERIATTNQRIEVREGGLKFWVNLVDYADTGLFLDHRVTRSMVRDEARGKHALNLFAYTGSFTVYMADGGAASTTSVDLSANYLDWADDNLKLNGLDGAAHQMSAMDIREFLHRHRPGEVYDLVVLDPPTFSNSKRAQRDWNVQIDGPEILADVLNLVRPGGIVYFSNNFRRFKLDTESIAVSEIHEISKQTVPEDYRNRRVHRCWRMVK